VSTNNTGSLPLRSIPDDKHYILATKAKITTKKWRIFEFWNPRFHPRAPIAVKFRMTKRTHVVCQGDSPLRGENADFWPMSTNNTSSLLLGGNPACNKYNFQKLTTRLRIRCARSITAAAKKSH